MGRLGAAELKQHVSNLMPGLRQITELAVLLPNAAALFTLAMVRAKIAENLMALRALRVFDVTDISELQEDEARVLHIVGSWALPLPPPSMSDEASNRSFPLSAYDLSAEAARLAGQPIEPALSDLDGLLRADLEIQTDEAFEALIQAVFAAGAAEGSGRELALPNVARTRADFVAHEVAMNLRDSLSIPGGTVNNLSDEDRRLVHVLRYWGAVAAR